MGIESSTITEDDYKDALQELIDKIDGQIFELKKKYDDGKKNIKEKLNKYKTAQRFIKPILESKKKINIASKMKDIFNELQNNFNENKINEKKKKLSSDKNDINVINAIFIEKKLNENDDDDDNEIHKDQNNENEENEEKKDQKKENKNKIKEYAEKLYEDDFDNIENGMDKRIDKEYISYFDDIEIEDNEIKKEYDDLCKEFKIKKPEEKPKEKTQEKTQEKPQEKPQENFEQEKPQENYEQDQIDSYYDIVFEIESLEHLKDKGWELKVSEKGKNKYEEKKKKDNTVVSVIGNKNKGKSFILSKISNIPIPDGHNITTKGLSIIYPDYEEKNIICLDTAGFEVPLCEDDKNFEFKIEEEEREKEYEEEKKNDTDITVKDYLSEDEYITQIQKFIRDRQNTDYFLQKFIIDSADILLCIVNKLNLSDQKFLNRIQEEIKNKKIFVIHNLKTFTKIQQVKDYIENTLLRSLTFKLEKNYYNEMKEEDKKFLADKNKEFYIQVFDEDEDEDKDDINNEKKKDEKKIIHLFLAKVGRPDENEASNYYNESTLRYIKETITSYIKPKKFPILDNVKNFLLKNSENFFNEALGENCELEIKDEFLKFKDNAKPNYTLKECTLNELGIPLFIQSNYLPKYRIYLGKYKDEGNKLFIDIEVSGKVTFDEINFNQRDGQNIVMIKGKRILTEEEISKIFGENKLSYLNNDFKVFNLRLFIKNEYGVIQKFYKVLDNKGIYTIIFNIYEEKEGGNSIHIDTDPEEDEEDGD